jgi:hypothetical protein
VAGEAEREISEAEKVAGEAEREKIEAEKDDFSAISNPALY